LSASRTVAIMGSILSAIVSLFAFRFRSRASLEVELIAVHHQLAVLRRQRPFPEVGGLHHRYERRAA
jgi:hypothetical protein